MPPARRNQAAHRQRHGGADQSLSLEGAKPWVLAVDGQPADSAFEPARATFPAGPGARFDLMFDLPREAGAEARLVLNGVEEFGQSEPDGPLIIFATEGEARPARPPIASLALNPLLPTAIRLQDAKRIELVIEPAKAADGDDGQAPLLDDQWRGGSRPPASRCFRSGAARR